MTIPEKFENIQLNFLIFSLIAILYSSLFFPGLMSPDSRVIYNEALLNSYSDHHPPLMAYVWHCFMHVIPGPASMFILNMLMLWGAIYILAFRIFRSGILHIIAILIPFTPHLAVYAGFIWKDIIFTFGYGLISMYLAYKTINKTNISPLMSIILFFGLTFFTAVKFQAQFVLPIILLWFFYVQQQVLFNWKTLLFTTLSCYVILFAINSINNLLVTTENSSGSSHSWQYVKIYDLAGISVFSNKIVFPKTFLRHEDVKVADIAAKYEQLWEPLVVYPDSPVRKPKDAAERQELLLAWRTAVYENPLRYLQHRSYIWTRGLLLAAPGKGFTDERLGHIPWVKKFVVPIFTLTAFLFLLPFYILSVFIGIKYYNLTDMQRYAQIILFLLTMGAILPIILFIFSLSASPRYIYFTVYMFMLSIPFSIFCLSSKNESN